MAEVIFLKLKARRGRGAGTATKEQRRDRGKAPGLPHAREATEFQNLPKLPFYQNIP